MSPRYEEEPGEREFRSILEKVRFEHELGFLANSHRRCGRDFSDRSPSPTVRSSPIPPAAGRDEGPLAATSGRLGVRLWAYLSGYAVKGVDCIRALLTPGSRKDFTPRREGRYRRGTERERSRTEDRLKVQDFLPNEMPVPRGNPLCLRFSGSNWQPRSP